MNEYVFKLTTRIARPAAEVFAWHERPGALERLCPPWERIEVIASQGGIRDGARVVVRGKVGPFSTTWRVEHRDYVPGEKFRDVQLSGPFSKWEHLHEITAEGPAASLLTDTITYRLPFGALGNALGGGFVRRKLERMFAWRHAVTRADLESSARYGEVRRRRILISGASGLVGRALGPFFQTQGHEVLRLVRQTPKDEAEIFWDPSRGELDAGKLEGVDAVIHLAGENVGGGRWTAARRERIMRSRVEGTRTLVLALAKLRKKPETLVSASAVGFYGERGSDVLSEGDRIGHGFLSEVCLAWETHAEGAARLGIRTVLLRFGVVLSPAGGALAKLLPAFRAGCGGRLGSGAQWMSWISIDDAVGAIHHALLDDRCSGPVNAAAPQPVQNAEFATTLGRVLQRPAVLPVPATVLRLGFGRMAEETILTSTRAVPEKLQETGFEFRHAGLETALRHVLGRPGKV
ncbi:MAG TPA: TIGR01777 family oxidoreductase [Opitutaceae bacterium]|nr:TIGR01777 family oxidoreductase [Opitutaceae bacterium]